jgi:hypothetical protein
VVGNEVAGNNCNGDVYGILRLREEQMDEGKDNPTLPEGWRRRRQVVNVIKICGIFKKEVRKQVIKASQRDGYRIKEAFLSSRSHSRAGVRGLIVKTDRLGCCSQKAGQSQCGYKPAPRK